jgi:ankyrin repeat protein
MRNIIFVFAFIAAFIIRLVDSACAYELIKPDKKISQTEEQEFIQSYKNSLKKEKLDYRPPLVWAVVENHPWFVEMLLRHGEKLEAEERNGGNGLSAAILNKREEIYKLLIDS